VIQRVDFMCVIEKMIKIRGHLTYSTLTRKKALGGQIIKHPKT
jgi:hypothetical protein